jgi:hypothetical protein
MELRTRYKILAYVSFTLTIMFMMMLWDINICKNPVVYFVCVVSIYLQLCVVALSYFYLSSDAKNTNDSSYVSFMINANLANGNFLPFLSLPFLFIMHMIS